MTELMELSAEQEEFEAWLSKQPISDVIFQHLRETGRDMSCANAQKVWEDILEHELNDTVHSSMNYSLPLVD